MTRTTPPARPDHDAPAGGHAPRTGRANWSAVDRELVHKRAAAEVLVTGLASVDPQLVAVAARWPGDHRLYDRRPGTAGHLLLLVESIRQAGLCTAHRHLGVPLGEQFIFHRIATRLAAPVADLRATEPTRTVTLLEPAPRYRAGRPSGAALTVEVWCGSTRWATAEAHFSCAPLPAYQRLRAAARTRPAATGGRVPGPRDAGVTGRTDGVVRSRLLVDRTDPTFFDHEVDHLPGMLLIDAALRAAAARTDLVGPGPRLSGIDIAFGRFAELGTATWVGTEPADGAADRPAVDVTISQAAGPVARGRVVAAT
ncbi:ScbA/BarX family gamma-butyrolactone biosynthesis protein [Blastococcus montanus]|uniref:ScbA/BarX family gamma-butyrolactone biosynthesis protein n=1 Tax=Blastococcus montanus TaxID=3144973 RepID=UPI00320B387E